MSQWDPNGPAEPEPNPDPKHFSLYALLTDAANALSPNGASKIAKIRLCRIKYLQKSAFHPVTTKEADDFVAYAASDPGHANPCPPDAIPMELTLDFQIIGSLGTHTAEIRPDSVKLHTDHAAIILDWLEKSPLNISKKLAQVALVLLLATATTFGSPFDDDDTDDDDAEECPLPGRHHAPRPARAACHTFTRPTRRAVLRQRRQPDAAMPGTLPNGKSQIRNQNSKIQ